MVRFLPVIITVLLSSFAISGQTVKEIREVYSLVSKDVLRELRKDQPKANLYVVATSKLLEIEWNEGATSLERRLSQANKTSISLTPYLYRRNVVLIDNEEFEESKTRSRDARKAAIATRPASSPRVVEICGNHGMHLFEETYPDANGIHYFSRIGFDAKRKQAIIAVEWYTGCGGSTVLYTLRQKRAKWVIQSVEGDHWVA